MFFFFFSQLCHSLIFRLFLLPFFYYYLFTLYCCNFLFFFKKNVKQKNTIKYKKKNPLRKTSHALTLLLSYIRTGIYLFRESICFPCGSIYSRTRCFYLYACAERWSTLSRLLIWSTLSRPYPSVATLSL